MSADLLRAQRKALRRQQAILEARERFSAFVPLAHPHPADPDDADRTSYVPGVHLTLLDQYLQRVADGKIKRLIVSMPPRAGKSQKISKDFQAWFRGRRPDWHTMFATYSDDFAQETGAWMRDTLQKPWFQQVFPRCRLQKGSQASDFMKTTEGGESAFIGVGGAGTGKGAHLLIVDDPVKNDEEARSPARRQTIWEWFTKVAMTRLMAWRTEDEGAPVSQVGAVIIVMTRWHEDDLVGRAITIDGEAWEVLNLPAIQDDEAVAAALGKKVGDPLWPEMYPLSFLEQQRSLNPLGFSCLYQGKPTAEEGDVFRREWLRTYRTPPENLRIYLGTDFAVSTKTRRDKTAVVVAGICPEGNIYLLDAVWRQIDSNNIVKEVIALLKRWKPDTMFGEKGQIASTIGPFLADAMERERVWVHQDLRAATQDKRARAQSIRGLMAQGRVFFPEKAWWYASAVSELMGFPNGKHDDFVDAIAWLGLGISRMVPKSAPTAKVSQSPPEFRMPTMGQLLADAKRRSSSKATLF